MKKQTNKQTNTPSVVSTLTPAPVAAGGFTLGLDLGDRNHYVCVLDAVGEIVHEGPLLNDRVTLAALLAKYPAATVALEAGTHSPWISRYLTGLGATVIIANPRKLHAISRHERKCDRRDAVMLARLARADATLLHPIQHGSAQAQHDLLGLKLRDSISKCGDGLLRRLLVSAAHYILGPFGPACALRAYGQHLAGTSAREQKRAVVAVARKLAVLRLSLWKHGTDYEPRVPAVPVLVLTPA